MNEAIREARDEHAGALLRIRPTLPGMVVLVLAVACQQGGAPPAEPNQAPAAPASAEPAPAPPADTAGTPTEASGAATPETPPAPAAPAAPESTGAADTASAPGKTKAPNHAAAAPAPAASATPAPADPNPVADACTTRNFHYTLIGSACRSGGRKAVKEIMKGAVKKAKAAGTDLKCTSCHEDTSTFHLKSNAVSDLKQWL